MLVVERSELAFDEEIAHLRGELERIAVSDDEILAAQLEMGREMGIYTSPEGAATWAALKALRRRGFVSGGEDIVLFATAVGIKYA